jgi:hypothetical protein
MLMNGSIIMRGLDSQGIPRGVKTRDVFPADHRDGFAAAREMACEARARSRTAPERE